MKTKIATLALFLAAGGCAADHPEPISARPAAVAAPVQEVGIDRNGSTVVLPRGGQLIVALAGNRTTGYFWEVGEKPAILSVPTQSYVQDGSAPGMVGVGGTERFTFRATGAGRGMLRLEHRGAGNRGVAETWRINVIVR